MRVALVQPNTRCLQGTVIPPFGIMYIAAMAREAGHDVKIFDRNIDFFSFSKIKKFNPDIVGVSGFTGPGLIDILNVTKQVKKMLNIPIIMGGVHATFFPEQVLKNDSIDYVIVGEGEHTFIELLDAIDNRKNLFNIKGIGFKDPEAIVVTAKRELMKELDNLPKLPWDLVNYKKYFKFDIILITSRGCPYRCAFCYNLNFNKSTWRGMTADRVIEEIQHVEALTDNKNLGFHDDNFTADKDRVYKILDYLSPEYKLFIETRINYITKDFLDRFKKFKSVWFFIGVESGSQRILNKMRKGITVKQIEEAFDLINEYGYSSTASVVVGSPTETEHELQLTKDLLARIKPTRYCYNIYTPYPGSEWYTDIIKDGKFKQPETFEEWGKYAGEILGTNIANRNLSEIRSSKLIYIDIGSWVKTLWEIVKTMDLHKIKMRLTNYEPFLIPRLDWLDKRLSLWTQ